MECACAKTWFCFVLGWAGAAMQALYHSVPHHLPRPCHGILCLCITQTHSQQLVLSIRRIHIPGFQEAFPQKEFRLGWDTGLDEVQMTPPLPGELAALFCKQQAASNLLLLEFKHF